MAGEKHQQNVYITKVTIENIPNSLHPNAPANAMFFRKGPKRKERLQNFKFKIFQIPNLTEMLQQM